MLVWLQKLSLIKKFRDEDKEVVEDKKDKKTVVEERAVEGDEVDVEEMK